MDSHCRPPNLLGDTDPDPDHVHVPRIEIDKGKRKAEGNSGSIQAISTGVEVELLEPLERGEYLSHGTRMADTRSTSDSNRLVSEPGFGDSGSTPSQPPLISIHTHPITNGDDSDTGQGRYQVIDEGSASYDQVCPFNSTLGDISGSVLDWQMDTDSLPDQRDELDLAYSIKGMYRILDLFSEQSSTSGLGEHIFNRARFSIIDVVAVDKIIISQNSLEEFINSICPGAYSSMTKVNFEALDDFVIKPVGVYGSKEEIVRFLFELGAIDGTMYGTF